MDSDRSGTGTDDICTDTGICSDGTGIDNEGTGSACNDDILIYCQHPISFSVIDFGSTGTGTEGTCTGTDDIGIDADGTGIGSDGTGSPSTDTYHTCTIISHFR